MRSKKGVVVIAWNPDEDSTVRRQRMMLLPPDAAFAQLEAYGQHKRALALASEYLRHKDTDEPMEAALRGWLGANWLFPGGPTLLFWLALVGVAVVPLFAVWRNVGLEGRLLLVVRSKTARKKTPPPFGVSSCRARTLKSWNCE